MQKQERLSDDFIGVYISGTTRVEDLLRVFTQIMTENGCYPHLTDLEKKREAHMLLGLIEYAGELGYLDEQQKWRESAMVFWQEVHDYLNEIAPQGCYFGNPAGDGACWGFWKMEEKEAE